uniref:Uncharacterized protein n=1 Tax=Glossina brevipalpis TaxID=37001 RepID=A0A1A9WYD5_9MUSC
MAFCYIIQSIHRSSHRIISQNCYKRNLKNLALPSSAASKSKIRKSTCEIVCENGKVQQNAGVSK